MITPDKTNHKRAALLLWVLTGLFLGRVVGQIPVALFEVPFLPPMSEWYSGLLPYPLLLPVQSVMLFFMFRINLAVATGKSSRLHPRPRLSKSLLIFGLLYIAVIAARYFISGSLHPDRRWWPPGILPIVFHWILAAYVLTLARIASLTGKQVL